MRDLLGVGVASSATRDSLCVERLGDGFLGNQLEEVDEEFAAFGGPWARFQLAFIVIKRVTVIY